MNFYAKTPEYRVVHRNLSDVTQVTTAMTYEKGSWTLHMLRQVMGDDRCGAGIRDYYARHQNVSASTNDFRLAMKRASGRDLSAFFQQWLYRGGTGPHCGGTGSQRAVADGWPAEKTLSLSLLHATGLRISEDDRFPTDRTSPQPPAEDLCVHWQCSPHR